MVQQRVRFGKLVHRLGRVPTGVLTGHLQRVLYCGTDGAVRADGLLWVFLLRLSYAVVCDAPGCTVSLVWACFLRVRRSRKRRSKRAWRLRVIG